MTSIHRMISTALQSSRAKRRINNRIREWDKTVDEHLKRIPQPDLSAEQIRCIDEYWAQYGIKMRDYRWYKWYFGYLSTDDPRYIPQDVYHNSIIPYYNEQNFESTYKNKVLFDVFLPECNFPKTIVKRINDAYYDGAMRYLTSKEAAELIAEYSEIIVKNATETGQGKNVKKYAVNSLGDAEKILSGWAGIKNYVVQEVIHQHPFFAQFNESSVNIIRINSFFSEGNVYIHTPVLRFGLPGYATDCARIDGEEIVRLLGISDKGEIADTVIHLNGDKTPVKEIVAEPIRKVPAFDKILRIVEENAKQLPYQPLIGWDITVDTNSEPVVIEYNICMPSPYSSQIADGPLWGNDTDRVLAFLKDEENRKKYIPRNYQL